MESQAQTATSVSFPSGLDRCFTSYASHRWSSTPFSPFDILAQAFADNYSREGHPGVYETTISILPGTHHIRFLVDGVMQTSPDLPTTVDFGNNLVNYIEVSPDDVRAAAKVASAKEAAEASAGETAKAKGDPKPPRGRAVLPADHYRHEIPQYLVDLDLPDDSPSYQHAYSATEKLATPPALPGFLGKPILNATTPIKDDNSVLNLPPNHAVLNHLATSSIKNNVLAVSATTRYKNKVSLG